MRIFLFIITATVSLSLSAQNYQTHKVEAGQTIETIAKQYLVTPFDIYALNPDAATDFKPNMVLIIPNSKVKNDPVPEQTKTITGYIKHKVKRKETLYSISKKYNIEIEDIKRENRHLYAENLRKGEKIRIPKYKTIISKSTLSNTVKKYTVLPKEGKWRIAYKFGITVAELEALNPNMKPVIQPGDVLNVPNINDEEEKPVETTYNYYEVLPKEGFYRLKIKLGLTKEALEDLNPELKTSGLKAGMVLKIPQKTDMPLGVNDSLKLGLENQLINFSKKKLALILPYRLNRIDTDSVAEAKEMIQKDMLLSPILDFHSGVLMALDSAKQHGISTALKVFDSRFEVSAVERIIQTNDFKDYDAVIGPVKAESFDFVAKSLGQESIPVLAPITQPKTVYANVFQTLPKDDLLAQTMIDFVKADSTKTKVIIISDQANRATSQKLKTAFSDATLIFSRKNKKTGKDDFFIYPTELKNVFQEGKTIVFLETDNNPFASSIISMLNGLSTDKTKIILVTLDKNKAFEGKNIDNYHLSNLSFRYPSTRRTIDYDTKNGFVKTYKDTYGVLPSKFAVRGFDITLDVLMRLAYRENLYDASKELMETEYLENKFKYNKKAFGGYINEAVYIVKYDKLKIINVN